MVISRTKYDISEADIRRIFAHAGLSPIDTLRSLAAG